MKDWGESEYRAQQIWQGLYHTLYAHPDQFTSFQVFAPTIGNSFFFFALTPEKSLTSQDGETVKTLFRLHDGRAIETVWMGYHERDTLCISTQAGCGMGCVFCATGQMGFQRNLSSGEIVGQVVYYARKLLAENKKVTNVVVMGMGEPFHNYDATMDAIDRLNHRVAFPWVRGASRFQR